MIPSPYRHDFDKYELFDRVLGHPVEKYWQNFLKKRKVHVKEKVFGREVENPKVSLIIPIYGRYDFIRYQLAHFANDGDFADAELIYIVDDPQIVDEVISASVRYHDVFGLPFKIVSFDQNLGYAGANNMGVSYSSADMLLLMNSDIIPQHKGWLSTLYNLISSSENIGAVGPILLFYDGSIQHMGMDVYYEPTLPKYILNSHPNKGMLIDIPPTPYQVKMLSGACVMLRKKDYQNIGGFDEGYIVGDFEDSDLCLRLRALGKEFYVDPRARLFHLERQSQMKGLNHDLRFIITLYNGWRYAEKIRNGKLTHPEAIKL